MHFQEFVRMPRLVAIGVVVGLLVTLLGGAVAAPALAVPIDLAPAGLSVTYTINTAIPVTTFTATGTGVVTFTAPALPAGLTLNPATGELGGTPTEASTATSYDIVATDAADSLTAATTITIAVAAASLAPAAQDVTAVVGLPFATAPLVGTGFGGAVVYSISPAPPVDVAFDIDSGILSGTLTAPLAETTFTVTGTSGTTTATADVVIRGPPATLTPSSQVLEVAVNTALSPAALVPAGFAAAVTYSINPATLPAGVTFAPATGALTGTPTVAWPTTVYTITGADGTSSASSAVSLTVTAPPLTPSPQVIAATAGTTITPTTAYAATGLVAPIAYTVTPALPAGLVLSPTTGAISGKPTTVSAAVDHTVTATDANGVTATGIVTTSVAQGQLAAPVIFLVQAGTETGSLRVLFTASTNAPTGQVYAAEVYDVEQGAVIRTVRPFTSTTSIAGLTPGATYQVVIIADGSASYLEARSAPRTGLAAQSVARLAAPVITSIAGGTTPGSLVVTFSASANAPAGQTYTARVYDENQTGLIRTLTRVSSPVQITGLTPGATYYVIVSADASMGFLESPSRGRSAVATAERGVATSVVPQAATTTQRPAAPTAQAATAVRLGGGWFLLTPAQASSAKRVVATAPPAADRSKAPKVKVPRNRAVSIQLRRLPASTQVAIEVRIGRTWVSMGSVRTTASGRLVLPAFRATKAGRFVIRLMPSSAIASYVTVVVRSGGGGAR